MRRKETKTTLLSDAQNSYTIKSFCMKKKMSQEPQPKIQTNIHCVCLYWYISHFNRFSTLIGLNVLMSVRANFVQRSDRLNENKQNKLCSVGMFECMHVRIETEFCVLTFDFFVYSKRFLSNELWMCCFVDIEPHFSFAYISIYFVSTVKLIQCDLIIVHWKCVVNTLISLYRLNVRIVHAVWFFVAIK